MEFADNFILENQKSATFSSSELNYGSYQVLKKDAVEQLFDLWLNDEMINFFPNGWWGTKMKNI